MMERKTEIFQEKSEGEESSSFVGADCSILDHAALRLRKEIG